MRFRGPLAKGDDRGIWLSAAALDRYLQEIGRPQVFGTQYRRNGADTPWTQEPIDHLFGDRIRSLFGVSTRAQAEERVQQMNAPAGDR